MWLFAPVVKKMRGTDLKTIRLQALNESIDDESENDGSGQFLEHPLSSKLHCGQRAILCSAKIRCRRYYSAAGVRSAMWVEKSLLGEFSVKLPELDALTMAYNAVQQGAVGVDIGRGS
jgi:hypothetical protein